MPSYISKGSHDLLENVLHPECPHPNYQTYGCVALCGKTDFEDVMKVKVLDGKRKLAYSGGPTDGITRVLIRGRQEMLLHERIKNCGNRSKRLGSLVPRNAASRSRERHRTDSPRSPQKTLAH